MKKILLLIVFNFVLISFLRSQCTERPRLLVLTDIGGDPDDIQSLRRLLLYSNEFKMEGFIATATWGPVGKRTPGVYHTNENLIFDAISDYGEIRNNLLLHSAKYPTADTLNAIVFHGQPNRGVKNLTPGKSTPGSQHIIRAVDESNHILNIVIWGGAHDLAQALLDVKLTRSETETSEFISKIRVYAIGDQDKKYAPEGTGEWIIANFPGIFYIQEEDVARGMFQNDTPIAEGKFLPLVKEGVEQDSEDWVRETISGWGKLMEAYPDNVNQNPKSPRNTKGVKEGDTPSWFYFLPNGLSNPEHPEWGCWGGRFKNVNKRLFTDAMDDHWTGQTDGLICQKWTVARWREAYQNDFAARARWCVLPYKQANHNPVLVVENDSTAKILSLHAYPGQKISISATNSYDPDRNKMQYNWWIYNEVTSSSALLLNSNKKKVQVEIPKEAPSGEIHIVLEAKDNGKPVLRSYRRVIVKVLQTGN
ncbi:MAG: DUF1593 domain-containing protein [Prolixibacteraceae bacterium]